MSKKTYNDRPPIDNYNFFQVVIPENQKDLSERLRRLETLKSMCYGGILVIALMAPILWSNIEKINNFKNNFEQLISKSQQKSSPTFTNSK